MPISADPKATFDFVLKSDADKPAESRPAFQFRFMTRRELSRFERLRAEAFDTKDDAETFAKLSEAILISIVGWRNINDAEGKPIPFTRETWDEPLTDREIWEMAINVPGSCVASEGDRSKSLPPSQSAGVESVPLATAENAPTSPAK